MRRIFSRQKPQTKSPKDSSIDLNKLKRLFSEGIKLELQSDWSEAAERFKTCVINYEKVLGPNHESTAASHAHLAAAYSNMNRFAEAESHSRMCEAARVKTFGQLHTYTLDAASSVFWALWDQGKAEEAKIKGKSLLATLEKTEGSESLRALKTVLGLGEICVYLGQYESAILHHRRALTGLESVVGIGSTETINARFQLGSVYGEMGNFVEATTIYKQNQEVCEKTRGVTSELFLRATLNLGRMMQRRTGNEVEAEKTYRSMLPASKADTAHQHWEKFTAKAVQELVRLYKDSGRNDDAYNIEMWASGKANVVLKVQSPNLEQQDTPSWSPRVGDDEDVFNWDIKILTTTGGFSYATALLDTQCQKGNWISLRLVKRLGKESSISQNFIAPEISDASGSSITATGVIELEWKRHPRGNRVHQCHFFVFPTSEQLDVIFGVEYIVQEKLLLVNNDALVPLLEHKKLNKKDKAAIALAEERQRQEKAALEARRLAAQQGGASQSQTQQQQQGQ